MAKTVIAATAVVGVALPASLPASAASGHAGSTAPVLSQLQDRCDRQIQLRLQSITKSLGNINAAKFLSAPDRATLTSQVGADQSGLTALETKIKADTTAASTLADCETIVTGYRWYMMESPKVSEVIAADAVTGVAGSFTALEPTLQQLIDAYNGSNKAAVQAAFTDLQAKVIAAQNSADGVAAAVISLVPSDCPACVSTLKTARSRLGTARDDLETARNDAKTIRNDVA